MVHLLYQCWYFVASKTLFFFFQFSLVFLFFSTIFFRDTSLHLIVMSPLAPLAVTVPYRTSRAGACLKLFWWWGWLMCFWEEDQRGRVPFPPHTECTYLSAWLTGAVNLDPLAEVKYSSSFSAVYSLFPLSFLLLLSRRKSLYTAHSYAPYLRSGVSMKITWRPVYFMTLKT